MAILRSILVTIGQLLARAWRFWMRDIQSHRSLKGKIASIGIGLFVLCCAFSLPFSLVNGPQRTPPVQQAAAISGPRPTTDEAAAPSSAPATMAQSPTTEPTATQEPTATHTATATRMPTNTPEPTIPPTNTPEPTATPEPTPEPTATPEPPPPPTATPEPPQQIVAPASNPLNTDGANLYNCGDFSNYQEALAVYKANLPGDPNDLDRDNDGIPCESLRGAP
jgi:hypothetical protein